MRSIVEPACWACVGLPEFGRWIALDVLWHCWGRAYYETREAMWNARRVRPLFPVAVALGDNPWSTGFQIPPPLRRDVAAIRADYVQRTGRRLRWLTVADTA